MFAIRYLQLIVVGTLFVFMVFSFGGCATQRTFAAPDAAVTALVDSMRSDNQQEMHDILGGSSDKLLFSGDAVDDKASIQRFLAAYDQKHDLSPDDAGQMVLSVGNDDWPLPIPLVKNVFNQWTFDTAAGKDELINRRVGRNELDTIQTCLAIVDAQREYAETDPQHIGMPVYAEKFRSDPGKKNGLYWKAAEGEPPSPLGSLVATAQSEGYSRSSHTSQGPDPYHGYLFRILTSQGPAASGGARDYLVDGKLLSGFAIVAYPASYGSSGVMTFIIDQDGAIYQRDLGSDTAKLAPQIKVFNPDDRWEKVDPDDEKIPEGGLN